MVDLQLGDCLELMKNIPDGSVDLVLSDPPYGIAFKSNRRKEKYNKIIENIYNEALKEKISSSELEKFVLERVVNNK